ncbi:MAG: hypothetical protein KA712_02045 [Myxococcales bacterium]|nr:hypothetical protein [Myxococcales bacterium]
MSQDPVVPPALLALHAIFTSALQDLRFGNFDESVLGAAIAQVAARADAVAEAEAALAEARAGLAQAQDELLHTGQRALAYARIYAEDDSELSERLLSLAVTVGGRDTPAAAKEPVRRRGRPGKTPASALSISLPLGPPASGEMTSAGVGSQVS